MWSAQFGYTLAGPVLRFRPTSLRRKNSNLAEALGDWGLRFIWAC
jgi:hypothetical protein